MPPAAPKRTWRDWQEINPFLFPSLIELRDGPGLVGWALQTIPEGIVRDADRCPDPWHELSRVPFVKQGHREFYRAAASLVSAVERLAGICGVSNCVVQTAKQRAGECRFRRPRFRLPLRGMLEQNLQTQNERQRGSSFPEAGSTRAD